MAVKMRLRRIGRKKVPCYRVVVADIRSRRDGRVVETVGHYDPLNATSPVTFKTDRVTYWLAKGVKPTETVGRLLKKGMGAPIVEESPKA